MLVNVVAWALFIYGLTFFIVESAIFMPVRVALLKLTSYGVGLYCWACTAFWVGAISTAISDWTPLFTDNQYFISRVFATGTVAMGLGHIVVLIGGEHPTFGAELVAAGRSTSSQVTEYKREDYESEDES